MSAGEIAAVAGMVLSGAVMLFFLFALLSALIAAVLFRYTIHRRPQKGERTHSAGLDPFDAMLQQGLAWSNEQHFETVTVQSWDGLRLQARFLFVPGSKKAVLMMHGYLADTMYEFSCGMRYFYEHGYSVLLPAQRAHDESQGEYIGFGVLERYDVLTWSQYLTRRCGADCRILLHGISMGASTVLMASGLPLPHNVVGIISDCGFTSPEAIMQCVLHRDMRLYGFPILYFARAFSHRYAKFDTAYSTREALRHSEIPVLFIHGSDDELVPISMTLDNYQACRSPKRLMVVRGARHGCSYFTDTPAYTRAVEDFASLCGIV